MQKNQKKATSKFCKRSSASCSNDKIASKIAKKNPSNERQEIILEEIQADVDVGWFKLSDKSLWMISIIKILKEWLF